MKEVYLGRQPILDRNIRIVGYELLFRDKEDNFAIVKDSIEATARVIMNLLTYMDFKEVINNKLGFINVTPEFIEGELIDLLPEDRVVLEISNIERVNKFVLDSIIKVKRKGYKIALDNVKFTGVIIPLLQNVDYVKLNIKNFSDIQLKEVVDFLKKYSVKLVAVRVETEKDFLLTKEIGFDYFQGFFFEKPTIKKEKKISSYKIALLNIFRLSVLEKDMEEIEKIIKGYPDLTYKLLRYINSPFFYMRNKISSIRQALSILGYTNIQKWAVLQLFATEGGDVKTNPLLERAVIRGKMMEILTSKITSHLNQIEKSYITGMLSLLDVVLHRPMEQILESLYIDDEIKEAILEKKGKLGYLLGAIISLEKDQIDTAKNYLKNVNLGIEDLLSAELEAITFYENFMESQ